MRSLSNNPDLSTIERHFDTLAKLYSKPAMLSILIAERLLENLSLMSHVPTRILEIGCGRGTLSQLLEKYYPKSQRIGIDLSHQMLQAAAKRRTWFSKQVYIQANALQLPLPPATFDWVVSNNLLSWCSQPAILFEEIRRILKPGGLLLFSSLGPDTLQEIRNTWAKTIPSPLNLLNWVDMHDLGDILVRSGFQGSVLETERLTFTYSSLSTLLNDIDNTGDLFISPLSKNELLSNISLLDNYPRNDMQQLPLTFEVIYGHAFSPAQRQL